MTNPVCTGDQAGGRCGQGLGLSGPGGLYLWTWLVGAVDEQVRAVDLTVGRCVPGW